MAANARRLPRKFNVNYAKRFASRTSGRFLLCSQSKPSAILCSISWRSWFHSNLGNRLQPGTAVFFEKRLYTIQKCPIKNFEGNLVSPRYVSFRKLSISFIVIYPCFPQLNFPCFFQIDRPSFARKTTQFFI